MAKRAKSRPGDRKGGLPLNGKWVEDEELPLERKLIRWNYLYIMMDRNITFQDVADYLKVSRQQVANLMNTLCYGDEASQDRIEFLLDEVLTGITETRHQLIHSDTDETCKVLTVAGENARVVGLTQQLLRGDMGTW